MWNQVIIIIEHFHVYYKNLEHPFWRKENNLVLHETLVNLGLWSGGPWRKDMWRAKAIPLLEMEHVVLNKSIIMCQLEPYLVPYETIVELKLAKESI